ncbi:hypothetical protein K438DRAFT_1748207 [Mycena galopus ATCC 62051]|nr:hypothetical protein K438DRAFT_1748207 [Mycena galopus ATCC 62051]
MPSTNETTVNVGNIELGGGKGGNGGRGTLGTGGEGGIGQGAALFNQSGSSKIVNLNVACCCKLLTKHSNDSTLLNLHPSGPPLLTQHQTLLAQSGQFLDIIKDIQDARCTPRPSWCESLLNCTTAKETYISPATSSPATRAPKRTGDVLPACEEPTPKRIRVGDAMPAPNLERTFPTYVDGRIAGSGGKTQDPQKRPQL